MTGINDLCNLKYTGATPNKSHILISCSIFKLKDMYRNFHVYINGLCSLIEYISTAEDKTLIRIYFDLSIKNDKLFIDLYNNNVVKSYVQFCEYKCPSFILDNYHRGTFGTFVRFLPMFDSTLDVRLIYISDIDYVTREKIFYIKYVIRKFIKSDYDVLCIQKIGYEFKYGNEFKNKYLDGTCLANIYLKKTRLPIDIFTNTLKKLRDNNPEILNEIKKMYNSRVNLTSNSHINTSTFTYGIDEWFINKIVLTQFIININISCGVLYISDNIRIYPKYIINYNKSDNKILIEYFKKFNIEEKTIDNSINKLQNRLSLKMKNISDYNNFLQKYIEVTAYFIKNNLLVVDDKLWIKNLLKHKYTNGPIFILFHDKLYNENKVIQTLRYYSQRLKIIPILKNTYK